MRVIRAAGQNVSPADDGRLYSKAFADGLFEDVVISSLGTNLVSIGALYGIICGRDFTAEAQNITVILPETEGTTEGVIYVEIDISSDDVITIGSALKPFTPTYEDINMNGVVAQMVIAEYTATPVAVTDVTTVYPVATAGGIGSMATIELSPVQNSYAVGDFLVWKGQLYKVTAAIASGETLVIGTNIEAVTIGTELTALNKGLSNKQDKPTTGVIALSSTDCVPTAVGSSVYYHNDLLVNVKKVCVWCESLSDDLPATIDTLDGSVDYSSAIIDNTTVQAEGTPYANNFWKAKLQIAFRRSWGGIYLKPLFMGSSQTFANLRVTKIYYEK